MDDEGQAGVAILLWSIAFHAGMFIAAGINKPVGLMLMACSTAILIFALNADRKLQAEKKARNKYREDAERRILEAIRNSREANVHDEQKRMGL
ncbi:MAG: hypothetical protein J6Y64_04645 [Ruminococcus sp.]|nr:hypothetical protein [Ruminococcus sp.]